MYSINENITSIKYRIYDKKEKQLKTLNVEYLKSSKNYRQFIDEKELESMSPKKMLGNIDNIVKGIKINIFGVDREIDYSKLEIFDDNYKAKIENIERKDEINKDEEKKNKDKEKEEKEKVDNKKEDNKEKDE